MYTAGLSNISNYIQEITSIQDAITEEEIDPTLYTVSLIKDGDSFSKNANYKIAFDIDDITGASLKLTYNY